MELKLFKPLNMMISALRDTGYEARASLLVHKWPYIILILCWFHSPSLLMVCPIRGEGFVCHSFPSWRCVVEENTTEKNKLHYLVSTYMKYFVFILHGRSLCCIPKLNMTSLRDNFQTMRKGNFGDLIRSRFLPRSISCLYCTSPSITPWVHTGSRH